MSPNTLFSPFLNPLQWVPAGQVLGTGYHTKDFNLFWFNEQVSNWVQQQDYCPPWQQSDTIQLNFISNQLTPCTWALYACSNSSAPISTGSLTNTPSTALNINEILWRGAVPMTGLSGKYYMTITAGSGAATVVYISEGFVVAADQPGTLLFEYTNSINKQAFITDDGQIYSKRIFGFFDNRFKPKYKGSFYIDQPQDISIINAIPYETRELWIGMQYGIPDYEIQKIFRIMLLDTINIEGIGYSLDEGAEWEDVFTPGAPMKYWKTTIRREENIDGISASASGYDTNGAIIATFDAQYLGSNNSGLGTGIPDIIQVNLTNP